MKKSYISLKDTIREIKDFPTSGITFYDITPLLENPRAFREAINEMVSFFQDKKIDKVVGIDARRFLLAAPVAYLLNAGLVLVRKKGKLPHDIIMEYHTLEYGQARLEIHEDAIWEGERVAVIDDVLATGGTAEAGIKLVEKLKGRVRGVAFLLEVPLGGREKLAKRDIFSVITYEK